MQHFFNVQIKEISVDKALRFYGAFLAVGQMLSFRSWYFDTQGAFIGSGDLPVCWPFFESCHAYTFLNYVHMDKLLLMYGVLSVLSALLFLRQGFVKQAYFILLILNIFKTIIYFQDYRFWMNQHYMLYWVSFAYLFMPNKKNCLRYLVVAFYLGAACLKFNHHWISGSTLYNPVWLVPKSLIPFACAYVIFMETIVVWGLLSRNRWLFWGALSQVGLFHTLSFPTVGMFYPLLMYSLLMIFPLSRYFDDKPSSLVIQLFGGKQARSTYVVLVVFAVAQAVPAFIPGDSRVTGEGRAYSLSMFDGLTECEGAVSIIYRNGERRIIAIPAMKRPRTKCDPLLNMSLAKRECYRYRKDPKLAQIDISYTSRLRLQPEINTSVEATDVCAKEISISTWRANHWITR